jgi:hypothetical protein
MIDVETIDPRRRVPVRRLSPAGFAGGSRASGQGCPVCSLPSLGAGDPFRTPGKM